MQVPWKWLWGCVFLASSGCAAKVSPAQAPGPRIDVATRLAAASAQLTVGCLDCLLAAHADYAQVLAEVPDSIAAADGLARTAVLIALRESELGLPSSGSLDGLANATSLVADPATGVMVTLARALTSQPLDTRLVLRSQNEWADALRPRTADDSVVSYVWLALACGPYNSQIPNHEDRADIEQMATQSPLVAYKLATACRFRDKPALLALREREPRLVELDYWIGLVGLSGQPQVSGPEGHPDLDLADQRFTAAHGWRQDWPAVTGAIASVALTAEDFARAAEFYDKTIVLRPDDVEARVGKLRALSYLGRSAEAVAVADELLAMNRNPGEARYWRAYNQLRLGDLDVAWTDVEAAATTLINAAVPKLAGLIAIRRTDLTAAKDRLLLSISRQASDCETHFYLQAVQASGREWRDVVATAARAATCFDGDQTRLRGEVEAHRREAPTPRRDRVIARKEAELVSVARMRATVLFNGAAANFNLANRDEARRLAERLTEDEQYGERARALIEQLGTRQ